MDILGIGPMELLFIVLIALIVLGPKDMIKAGRSIGRALKAIVTSDTWRVVNQASREMRNLPNRLMREANLEDIEKQLPTMNELSQQAGLDEIKKGLQVPPADLSAWTTPPTSSQPKSNPQAGSENPAPAEDQSRAEESGGDQVSTSGENPVTQSPAGTQRPNSWPTSADKLVEGDKAPTQDAQQKGNDQA